MTALVELDLALRQGSFALAVAARLGPSSAVLGPSGAGKTTLLEAIAGLRRAVGRLAVAGEVLQDSAAGIFLPPERRHLGYVPQQGALFPHLSVLANLTFGRPGRRAGGEDFERLVAGLELLPLLGRYPRHLSGGEQRRVALGRALLARPRLLLLDEPTAGLDPLRARKALAGIRRVSAELGVPLLVVTHDDREALALAAEVVLLEGGRVWMAGPARPVLLAARAGRPAGERPWDNVVPARLVRHSPAGGTSEVVLSALPSVDGGGGGVGGETVTIPYTPDLSPGAELLLSIDAEDLLIATVHPSGLSARNAVAGRVDEIIPLGTSVYARVGPWLAHLTLAAVAELGLTAGTPVWLVAKTHSWRVLSG